jgi:hypothetical protein
MGMVVVKAENWVGGVLGGEVIVVVEVEGAVAVLCLLLVVVVPVLASTSRSESTARWHSFAAVNSGWKMGDVAEG